MASPAASQDFSKGQAAYHAGDGAKAFKVYKRLAEQGHAEARSFLALMYSKGFGVAKDVAKAASWWLLAAEQGEAWVQVELGDLYERGEGVARDYVMAMLYNVAYASLWDDPYPG
tara:strand:+ start:79 stop:423 length:345 start_codon:yes stop_codon:yes gene_type:complete